MALAVGMTAATAAAAQRGDINVRGIWVLATDSEALAAFYEKAFGMSETRRPLNTATTKEIVVNGRSHRHHQENTPIVFYTRPQNAPAGAMAALILEVPSLKKAIESVLANGG